jgi:arylmalonate decarboxylase
MTSRPSRRWFLKVGGGAAACALLRPTSAASADEPTLGLIFPPLNYPIPPDAKRLYPSGVRFIGNGVGLPGGMTIQGYEEAIPRVIPAAKELAAKGASVVSVFGSSITFYKGRAFHESLIAQVSQATGTPVTTQSAGLLDGLRTIGATRVAVATAYTDEVTNRLRIFLEEYGFTVTSAKGLGFVQIPQGAATQEILSTLGADAYARSNKADALVLSCGALATLDLLAPLEGRIGAPVVSSTPHGLMNGVRLLGVSPKASGFGTVFAKA